MANPTTSTITLNVNGLNYPIKKQRFPDYITKNKIQPYILSEGLKFKIRQYEQVENKRTVNSGHMKAWVVIFISNKTCFKTKTLLSMRDRGYLQW